MHTDAHIRATQVSDLAQLKDILDQTELFPSDLLEQMIEPFISDIDYPDIWLSYHQGGAPVAFALCEPERIADGSWNVLATAVLPSFQGRGIGKQLMPHIANRFPG